PLDPFEGVGSVQGFPVRGRKGSKGEGLVAGLLEAGVNRLAAQLPLTCKPAPGLLYRPAALRVDHAPIILSQFLAQMGGSRGQQVPELVISAALNRDLGPLRSECRGQTWIAVAYRQH